MSDSHWLAVLAGLRSPAGLPPPPAQPERLPDWLAGVLGRGPRLLADLRAAVTRAGIEATALTAAGWQVGVIPFRAQGRLWWFLAPPPADEGGQAGPVDDDLTAV